MSAPKMAMTRREFLWYAAVAGLGFGLAGCGAPAPTIAPLPTAVAPTAGLASPSAPATVLAPTNIPVTATPASGGTLVLGLANVQPNLDPEGLDNPLEKIYFQTNISSTLLRNKVLPVDADTLPTPADVEGELASSFKAEPSGIVITLRPMKSSRGNTLTSEDVKWSFERGWALNNFLTTYYGGVAGIDPNNPVTVIDEKTLRVNGKMTPLALATLAIYPFPVLDTTEVKKYATADDPWAKKWLQANIASFAPYDVEAFTPNQELRLKANPNYWRGTPSIAQIIQRVIPNSSGRLQLLLSGDIDWARNLTNTDFLSLRGNPQIQAQTGPSMNHHFLNFLRPQEKPCSDPRVRQAVSLGIDRDALIRGPYQGIGVPARGFISASLQPQEFRSPLLPHDPAKAKALLAEAGYGEGLTLSLGTSPNALFSAGTDTQAVAVLIASQLKQIGVTVNLVIEASDTALAAGVTARKYDMQLRSMTAMIAEAASLMDIFYPSKGPQNKGYVNPILDETVAAAMAAPIGTERDKLVAKANEILRTDVPVVPLVDEQNFEAFKKDVLGWSPTIAAALDFSNIKRSK